MLSNFAYNFKMRRYIKVPAGWLLSRLPSGVITRNAFVCPYGRAVLVAHSESSFKGPVIKLFETKI